MTLSLEIGQISNEVINTRNVWEQDEEHVDIILFLVYCYYYFTKFNIKFNTFLHYNSAPN